MCLGKAGRFQVTEGHFIEFHGYVVVARALPEVETEAQLQVIPRLHILSHLEVRADGFPCLQLDLTSTRKAGVTGAPVYAEYLVLAGHGAGVPDLWPDVGPGEEGGEGIDSAAAGYQGVGEVLEVFIS